MNGRDLDGNGIPGFADGIDLNDAAASTQVPAGTLATAKLAIPVFTDPSKAKITFKVNGGNADANPASIQRQAPHDYVQADADKITIWTEDVLSGNNLSRKHAEVTAGGHWVQAGRTYTASELKFDTAHSERTFYIEGIHPSAVIPGERIEVAFDPDGTGTNVVRDWVRLTVIDVDADFDSDNTKTDPAGKFDYTGAPDGTNAKDQVVGVFA